MNITRVRPATLLVPPTAGERCLRSKSGTQGPFDRAVRHTTLGAMLDRSVTPSELRDELYSIVEMRPLALPSW